MGEKKNSMMTKQNGGKKSTTKATQNVFAPYQRKHRYIQCIELI